VDYDDPAAGDVAVAAVVAVDVVRATAWPASRAASVGDCCSTAWLSC
jgi:hypothetical protein